MKYEINRDFSPVTNRLISKDFVRDFVDIILGTLESNIENVLYLGGEEKYLANELTERNIDTLVFEDFITEYEEDKGFQIDLVIINEQNWEEILKTIQEETKSEDFTSNFRYIIYIANSRFSQEVKEEVEEYLNNEEKFNLENQNISEEFLYCLLSQKQIDKIQNFQDETENTFFFNSELTNLINDHVIAKDYGIDSFYILERRIST